MDELTDAIDNLGSLSTQANQQAFNEAGEQVKWFRESMLWSWLMHSDNKITGSFLPTDSGFSTNATVNTSEFFDDTTRSVPPPRACVQTTISVSIDDLQICANPANEEFEFKMESEDAHLLSMASQGVIETIDRLTRAIRRFEDRLTRAIQAKFNVKTALQTGTWVAIAAAALSGGNAAAAAASAAAGFVAAVTPHGAMWIDCMIYSPWFKFLTSVMPAFFRDGNQSGADELVRMGIQRKGILMLVLKHVREKLWNAFGAPLSAGQKLKGAIQAALMRRTPPNITYALLGSATLNAAQLIERTLPQKRAAHRQLFPKAELLGLESLDVETSELLARSASLHRDAVKETAVVFSRDAQSLPFVAGEWERGASRIVLRVAYQPPNGGVLNLGATARSVVDSFALVLQVPPDLADASASMRESQARALLLINDRVSVGALKRISSSMTESEEAFQALAIFAEFWTDELVAHGSEPRDGANLATAILQSCSARATARAQACSELILKTTEIPDATFFGAGDPMLKATLAGRDAAVVARRTRVGADASRLQMKRIRDVATELYRISKFTKQKMDMTIPSEPLQSLFMDPDHGHAAFERALGVAAVAPNRAAVGNLLTQAVCSAYPSLLVDPGLHPTIPPRQAPANRPAPMRPDDPADVNALVGALRARTAKLRLNFQPLSQLQAQPPTVDSITDALMRLGAEKEFYVPYGYGDPLPPLKTPPISAVMLGSVPVWAVDLRACLLDALNVGWQQQGRSVLGFHGRICPQSVSGCGTAEPPLSSPAIIDARVLTNETRYRFVASCFANDPLPPLQSLGTRAVANDAFGAASSFHQRATEALLSDAVCEIAWNAERMLQCLLVAVSLQGPAPPMVFEFPHVPFLVDTEWPRKLIRLKKNASDSKASMIHFAKMLVSNLQTTIDEVLPSKSLLKRVGRFVLGSRVVGGGLPPLAADRTSEAFDDSPEWADIEGQEDQMQSELGTGVQAAQPASNSLIVDYTSLSIIADIREWRLASLTEDNLEYIARFAREFCDALFTAFEKEDDYRDEFRDRMTRELDPDPNAVTDAMRRAFEDYRSKAGRTLGLTADGAQSLWKDYTAALEALPKNRTERLYGTSTAAMQQARERDRRHRHRLLLAYILARAMARAVVGPSALPQMTIADTSRTGRREQHALERTLLLDAVDKLKTVMDATPVSALRFSEACAISFLVASY